MPAELQGRAIALCDLAGVRLHRVRLLRRVLDRLDAELPALARGMSPLARLADVSALDGRMVTVIVDGARLSGVAAGIAPDGQLLLDTDDGRRTLAVGEVMSVREQPDVAVAS
jgi:biotin-(acetyl-CoA carboxylase) ligase